MKKLERCRACGSTRLVQVFGIEAQYPSNFVPLDQVAAGEKVPIEILRCKQCQLDQAGYSIDTIWGNQYWYKSGTNRTMRNALGEIATLAERWLNPGDVVLDIGSNDGTLLRSYRMEGLVRVGIDPAPNLAEIGSQGVDVFINSLWSASAYLEHLRRKAKVITACGMLYDLEDPTSFLQDVSSVLANDGVFIAQLMCLSDMLEMSDVGNLTHEHLEYYSIESLEHLLGRCNLKLIDVDRNDVNGRSHRFFIGIKDPVYASSEGKSLSPSALPGADCRLQKARQSQPSADAWDKFGVQSCKAKDATMAFLRQAKAEGKKVYGYGASTKGNVILQWYGIDSTLVTAIADRSPDKYGLYTVGSGIRICSEQEARIANPDYFLVLPYAFLPEFLTREATWRAGGGKFLIPLPEWRIV